MSSGKTLNCWYVWLITPGLIFLIFLSVARKKGYQVYFVQHREQSTEVFWCQYYDLHKKTSQQENLLLVILNACHWVRIPMKSEQTIYRTQSWRAYVYKWSEKEMFLKRNLFLMLYCVIRADNGLVSGVKLGWRAQTAPGNLRQKYTNQHQKRRPRECSSLLAHHCPRHLLTTQADQLDQPPQAMWSAEEEREES